MKPARAIALGFVFVASILTGLWYYSTRTTDKMLETIHALPETDNVIIKCRYWEEDEFPAIGQEDFKWDEKLVAAKLQLGAHHIRKNLFNGINLTLSYWGTEFVPFWSFEWGTHNMLLDRYGRVCSVDGKGFWIDGERLVHQLEDTFSCLTPGPSRGDTAIELRARSGILLTFYRTDLFNPGADGYMWTVVSDRKGDKGNRLSLDDQLKSISMIVE